MAHTTAVAVQRRASATLSPSASSRALTGPNANLGINIKKGAQLAIDQLAAKNPDCKVSLTDYDSQGSKDQSPALAEKAIDDKAVVGHGSAGASRRVTRREPAPRTRPVCR